MTGSEYVVEAGAASAVSAMMVAANIGVVPVEVAGGFRLEYGPEGVEQEPLDPLVRLYNIQIEVESIPGYRASGMEGTSSPSVEIERGWLEGGELFRKWSALQEEANWVARLERGDLKVQAGIQQSGFRVALIRQSMGGGSDKADAAKRYCKEAKEAEGRKDHTTAAMIWERAATNPTPVDSEKRMIQHHAFAAKNWFKSVRNRAPSYDPYTLRLARSAFLAYESDPVLYRMVLLKLAMFNETSSRLADDRRERLFDAGAYRLRIADSILKGGFMNRLSVGVASNMLGAAAPLFAASETDRIDPAELTKLAVSISS